MSNLYAHVSKGFSSLYSPSDLAVYGEPVFHMYLMFQRSLEKKIHLVEVFPDGWMLHHDKERHIFDNWFPESLPDYSYI